VSLAISINNTEGRLQNRNLVGDQKSPGAELAKSSNSKIKPLLLLLPFILLFVHWSSVRSYSAFCVPEGLQGWIVTIFTTGSPICSFNLLIMEFTAQYYIQAWVLLGITAVWWVKDLVEFCGGKGAHIIHGFRPKHG